MRATLSVVFLASASTMYLGLQARHVPPFDTTRATAPAAASGAAALATAAQLGFAELLAPGAGLRLSDKALSLDGKRVRMSGFMARMELPPAGGFYLVPHAVSCDEAGGGSADLPHRERARALAFRTGSARVVHRRRARGHRHPANR